MGNNCSKKCYRALSFTMERRQVMIERQYDQRAKIHAAPCNFGVLWCVTPNVLLRGHLRGSAVLGSVQWKVLVGMEGMVCCLFASGLQYLRSNRCFLRGLHERLASRTGTGALLASECLENIRTQSYTYTHANMGRGLRTQVTGQSAKQSVR